MAANSHTSEHKPQQRCELHRERLKNTTEIAKLLNDKKSLSVERCVSVDDLRYGFTVRDQLIECLQRENRWLRDENAHLAQCLQRNHVTPVLSPGSLPKEGPRQNETSMKYYGQPLIRNGADSKLSIEPSAHHLAGPPITSMKRFKGVPLIDTGENRCGSGSRPGVKAENNVVVKAQIDEGEKPSRVVTCYVVEPLRQPLFTSLFRGFLEAVTGMMLHDHDTRLVLEPYPPRNDPRARLAKHRPVIIPCLGASSPQADIDAALRVSGVNNTKNIALVVFHVVPRHSREPHVPVSRTQVSRELCGAVRLITDIVYVEGFEVLPGVFPCRHNDGALADVAHFFNS